MDKEMIDNEIKTVETREVGDYVNFVWERAQTKEVALTRTEETVISK